MAGLQGKVRGVGPDILAYLEAVANRYQLTIKIIAGKRTPDEQAQVTLDNWVKLKRGKVYSPRALATGLRQELNEVFDKTQDPRATDADRQKAVAEFLKQAGGTFGKKAPHARGRAVDILRRTLPDPAYRAITLVMEDRPEGRRDVCHFEAAAKLPPAATVMAQWPAGGGGDDSAGPGRG